MVKRDNQILHEIAEELSDDLPSDTRPNNFWLKKIFNGIKSTLQGIASLGQKVDALMEVEIVRVETELPTASKDTKNALYLVPNEDDDPDDAFDYYVTIEKGSGNNKTYEWEKVDSMHLDLSGYVEKSSTNGLIKNDGTIDTTQYLSQHQDISGKADISSLSTVATSGSYNDLSNKPSIPSSTSDLSDGASLVKTSSTTGLIKNDGTIDTNTYLTSHQDITGKADRTHKHIANSLNDVSTESITITYDDDSTETLQLLCKSTTTAPTINYYRDSWGITILRIDNLQNTKKYILWHNRIGERVLENRTYYQEQTGGITHIILYDEWYNVLAEWGS